MKRLDEIILDTSTDDTYEK
ncbi:Protein of unknown function [Bacillus cytotoxicus]|uniref:Uncharacterized protein n=1 Tax=Bacillus cytotoxicus TaxID=580165 RepID=A0AAX2CCK3_9BACI|nr:Protein of unknown function [Bacillus cytotoxicus]